jgi:hypothetical protein
MLTECNAQNSIMRCMTCSRVLVGCGAWGEVLYGPPFASHLSPFRLKQKSKDSSRSQTLRHVKPLRHLPAHSGSYVSAAGCIPLICPPLYPAAIA